MTGEQPSDLDVGAVRAEYRAADGTVEGDDAARRNAAEAGERRPDRPVRGVEHGGRVALHEPHDAALRNRRGREQRSRLDVDADDGARLDAVATRDPQRTAERERVEGLRAVEDRVGRAVAGEVRVQRRALSERRNDT